MQFHDGVTNMGIEGQFLSLTARTRREPAFVRDGRGRGYLHDIRRFAMWWIRASIQDYILRSWSLVKIGTTANQKKLFFKLRSAKSKIAAFESGDLNPDQVALIAKDLDVTDQDVIDMNRRLGGDKSVQAPTRDDRANGEWPGQLRDQFPSPEAIVVAHDEKAHQDEAPIAAI